ncbi:ankyrin repeat domain-containing protein [Anaeramoeba flamelloides]|uniref:Ankyrin repeat domain-containing protein n=1 Tax=Anaeramoeba flamelloides TaxID=1746091 RepID=A0ABQ8X7L9_9EUKA|nr:ankyrin repeat domain-containing protein [Anaeramoeba flamelloides]
MDKLFREPSCLDTNPFFIYLTQEQKQLYDELSKSQYTFCIPSCNSQRGMKFNKEMVLLHTLRKSPFYKGESVVLNNSEKSVIIENPFLNLNRGWRKASVIKIISTQVFFNQNYNPYDILIIEKPFIWFLNDKKWFEKRMILSKSEHQYIQSIKKRKQEIIKCFPKNLIYSQVYKFWLQIGNKKIRRARVKQFFINLKKFKKSYYLAKGFESHFENKLTIFYEEQISLLIQKDLILRTFPPDSHFSNKLADSIKILILGKLQYWEKIKDFYQYEDQFCAQQMQLLKKITPKILEIPEKFSVDYSKIIQKLQSLPNHHTAFEKLLIIDQSIILLNEYLDRNFSGSLSLSLDDLIPIFSYIIIKAKIPNLFSTAVYLNHFHLCNTITSKYYFEITLLDSIVEKLIYSQRLLNIYKNYKYNDFILRNKTNWEDNSEQVSNLIKSKNDKMLEMLKKKKINYISEKNFNQNHSLQIVEII